MVAIGFEELQYRLRIIEGKVVSFVAFILDMAFLAALRTVLPFP